MCIVESVEVTRWRGWHCVHRDSKWAPLVRDSSFSIHFDLAWSHLAHRAGQPFFSFCFFYLLNRVLMFLSPTSSNTAQIQVTAN